jgi:hypothetical protein
MARKEYHVIAVGMGTKATTAAPFKFSVLALFPWTFIFGFMVVYLVLAIPQYYRLLLL